jgi:hypothetical protein
MRAALSVFLAWMLSANSLPAKPKLLTALHGSQAPTSQKPTLKEQVLEIPAGSMIEVRLKVKEKLRGRLGEVSNEAFTVKLAKGNKIEDRKVAFDDVKSIKSVGGSKGGRTALYILAGVGVGLVVLIVVLAIAYRGA